MEVNGKIFTKPIITEIRRMIAKEPEISRCELSRRVCKIMDWYSANGKLQDMSCRKALLALARKKAIELPIQKQSYSFQKKRAHTLDYKIAKFKGELCDFGTIIIEDITSRYSKDSKIWFDLLDQYHYLGSGTLCGSQIRYIVKSSEHGYIGALAFSSATYKSKARDDYIGWSEGARRENIKYLISNDRMLIIPTVKVANLASHIISEVLSRLPSDWERRYAVRPLLIESYVDPSRFTGSSYKASNWVEIGYTSGRRDGVAKKIFIYKLNRNWRTYLCHETVAELGSMGAIEDASHWAEQEFGRVRFYDNRLKERLYTIAQDFYNDPEAGIPQACGNRARSIGAYRFFQNKKVTMDVLLNSHTEATIDRIKEHNVVLAPQDTTTLNYSAHPLTEGLGPVGKVDDNNIGLLLHDTLAFTEDGTPLGVIDAQCWARDPEDKGKSKRRKELPVEQKESMKWLRSFQKLSEIQKLCPETMLVSIGDREADIYELFHEALSDSQTPKLLVRSERTRKRKVEQEELWDFMSRQNIAGTIKIHIPRRSIKKAREAILDIRFAEVALTPPKRYSTNEQLKIWAVYLLEQSEEMPIEWMLLTTAAVNTFEDAQKIVEWYSGRWGIEVYHRVLKSGCRIKDRQLGNAEHIETSLGIDMVVAWRIYHMTMLGRETPNSPCTVFFKDVEWKALYSYVNKTPLAPKETPTLQEAIMMLGQIGGHLGRKSDGPPGTQTLWRGLQRLDTATEMYVIFTDKSPPATI